VSESSIGVAVRIVLTRSRDLFDQFDANHDEKLSLNEVAAMFQNLESKITSYPAVSEHEAGILGSL
jgi:hypothetical protein